MGEGMSHDELQHGNPKGERAGRSDEHPTQNNTDAGVERNRLSQTVFADGLAEREQAHGQRGGKDSQDGIIALIRQEVRQEVNQFFIEEQPQLHSPDALEGYKRVDPSMPGRIMSMAEKEQKAHIDADLLPIRAEAYAYRFAVTTITLFPPLLVLLGILLILNEKDIAGYIATVMGVIGGGYQIIGSIRPSRQGRSKDAGERTARHK